VAKANPQSVVVLETGGPVTMPWLADVKGVVQAWYPGARGAEAIARLLSGEVNFTAKLPITFPQSLADLPNREVPGIALPDVPMLGPDGKPLTYRDGHVRTSKPPFDIAYPEGADAGYRWYERKGTKPLFAFGHGLSYTSYAYRDLKADRDSVTFSVTNTGTRAGEEISQVYAEVPGRSRRLAGWARTALQPHETKTVTVKLEPLALSTFDAKKHAWTQPRGAYRISVGGASDDTALKLPQRR
jgi:beta-glucosidase